MVVLARVIMDAQQALSTAAGIKLLIDLVQDSTDNSILALACDCIARLSHTRAGTIDDQHVTFSSLEKVL